METSIVITIPESGQSQMQVFGPGVRYDQLIGTLEIMKAWAIKRNSDICQPSVPIDSLVQLGKMLQTSPRKTVGKKAAMDYYLEKLAEIQSAPDDANIQLP